MDMHIDVVMLLGIACFLAGFIVWSVNTEDKMTDDEK
jgi:hypothetical protein